MARWPLLLAVVACLWLLGGCSDPDAEQFGPCNGGIDCNISAVFFAQTHVQEPTYSYFNLVGNKYFVRHGSLRKLLYFKRFVRDSKAKG